MAALSAVLLLTACTGVEMGTLESAGSRADQTENVDLTVMIDETTVLYYRDMVEELRQEFSEYGIHSIEWSLPEVEKTVKTAMARKESIEVVKWFPNQMENFISSSAAMDLTPIWTESGKYMGGRGSGYWYV